MNKYIKKYFKTQAEQEAKKARALHATSKWKADLERALDDSTCVYSNKGLNTGTEPWS